uniref:C2H2-type domain-containing protein n=1 Tax=Mycena chlorophos TaxID=658473 RepID=A0ABQ0LWC0_MYCCL|nr:predicted protein [Mycena chlorophos]
MQKAFKKRNIPCLHPGCEMLFESFGGRTKHTNSAHPPQPQTRSPSINSNPDDPPTSPSSQGMPRMSPPGSPPPNEDRLVGKGTPCDRDGFDLEPGTEPEPWDERDPDDYTPFEDRASFAFADFLYTRVQMSGENISQLMQLLAALYPRDDPPFADEKQLYATVDAIPFGDIPWQSFSVQYTGPLPEGEVPTWMTEKYQVWFRSPLSIFEKQLANPDFKDEMDWAAKHFFYDGKRNYTDIFSGNWVWDKSDVLAEEPEYHGALLVPVITGSDKTCASVGTGHVEFHPYYGGIANLHNGARRGHREGLSLLGFLSIPKTDKKHADSVPFRKFRRQLFHASIARILSDLKEHMTKPKVTRCSDRHFRRALYELCTVISDYPEQVLYTCIVQGWCPM